MAMDRNYVTNMAIALLGPPTYKSSKDLRWGSHGSLSVSLEAGKVGYWYDHEVGEGGGFYSLVARYMGFTDQAEAIEWSERRFGLSPLSNGSAPSGRRDYAISQFNGKKAITIWEEASPLSGTPGEIYLRKRSLADPGCHCVRFHPRCPVNLSDGKQSAEPALIGLFREIKSDEPVAILRTFLRPDGSGKSDHPLLKNQKQMLGPITGAAIKISADEDVTDGLVVAEGLETTLSAYCCGWRPAWSLGSASALAKFGPIAGIEALTVMADRDDAGIRAAWKCVMLWRDAGAEARIFLPKRHDDWNDWIKAENGNA
jgi:hypothetical protein